MPYLHYPGQTAEPPLSHRDLSEKWAKRIAFASITGLNGTIDLVSRIKPVEGATVGRKGTDRGMLSSYTGNVAQGLVWSTLKPVPSIFNTGISLLIFANPTAGGTIQRPFFLGNEDPVPSNQYNQVNIAFNCTKAGVASSGQWSAFEYNFGFQGTADSTAGMVDGKWHVFVATRPPGFGAFTLYRDGVNVTSSTGSANGIVMLDGCRIHCHPSGSQGYMGGVSLAVAFNTPLTAAEVTELSADPWQILEARSFTWFFDQAVGGTTYNQSTGGSITAAGALTKQTGKSLSGSSTPAGTLTRLISKSFGGSITYTGNIVKLTQRALSSSITGTGSLATMILFTASMGGSITPSGAIAKLTMKALDGATTLAGAISKMTAKGLGGELTMVGALAKLTARAVSGSVTVAGAVTTSYQVLKLLAGSITVTGALGAVYIAFVAGVLKLMALMGIGQ
jgi:hypothetical protein